MQSKWRDKVSAKTSGKESSSPLSEDEGLGTVVYITGEDMEGQPQWAYALIHADQYVAFKEAEAQGNYQLADYGKVLYYGKGAEPPEDIKQKMAEDYDCNEQFEQEIETMFEEILQQIMSDIENEENTK